MPGFDCFNNKEYIHQFQTICKVKANQKRTDVCKGKTEELSHFMKEIFSYRFKDTPNYGKLRKILKELIAYNKLDNTPVLKRPIISNLKAMLKRSKSIKNTK